MRSTHNLRIVYHLSGPLDFYVGYRRKCGCDDNNSIRFVHSINQNFGEYDEVDDASKLQEDRDRDKEGKAYRPKLREWIDIDDTKE